MTFLIETTTSLRSHFLVAALLLLNLFATPAGAIVNGTDATDPRYQAVVSINGGSCTGTFVHPHFVLTAGHCIQPYGEGPLNYVVTDGLIAGQGNSYTVDYVYVARQGELGGSEVQDVALLRTINAFTGPIIPILPAQNLPHRAESYYCPRWEYTWPTVLGFSTNAGTVDARRRVGRAFAECDLEENDFSDLPIHSQEFKLDGHGRSVSGVRICPGDSGGPTIWDTGFGTIAIGGVTSRTDSYNNVVVDDRCPSDRGESFMSFIPQAFLDRVAAVDPNCAGTGGWQACTNPNPYGGRLLRYLGTVIDQCGEDVLTVPAAGGSVQLRHGETAAAEVGTSNFSWFCASSQEGTSAPAGTNFLVVKRALTDRQIIWDSYQRGMIVPYVLGSSQSNAASTIAAAGLALGSVSQVVSQAPAGSVVSQNPGNGAFVPPGSAVNISLSVGAVTVPSVLSLTKSAAISKLNSVGLGASASSQKACIDPGLVIAQFTSADSLVAPGSSVSFVVDSGTLKSCGVIK
jgi:hypothetical protein